MAKMKAKKIKEALNDDSSSVGNVIFLDVDGVIIPYNKHSQKIHKYFDEDFAWSPRAIGLMNDLVRETESRIVLTSSYRKKYDKEEISDRFKEEGLDFEVFDYTPAIKDTRRKDEIKEWLNTHVVDDFVIIDDEENHDILDYWPDNFVECNHKNGFDDNDYLRALDMLK